METRFYHTQEMTLLVLAEGLVLEYQAQGYEAQYFGDVNQTTVQLKKESTLRAITSFEKVLAISLHDVLTSIDQHIRYQQPQAQVGEPPTPLVHREMTGSST